MTAYYGVFSNDADDLCTLQYDNLINLSVHDLSEKGTARFILSIPLLPDSIQMIKVSNCPFLTSWPDCKLPRSLTNLNIVGTRLRAMPSLVSAINLETIDLHDNHIASIGVLPPNVATINLSYNKIYDLDWTLFTTVHMVNLSFNFLKEPPPSTNANANATRFIYDHNDIDIYTYCQAQVTQHARAQNVYNQNQNVHDTSVQAGARDAINTITEMTKTCEYMILEKSALVNDVVTKLYPSQTHVCCMDFFTCCIPRFITESRQMHVLVNQWCDDDITLYAGQVTYSDLLGMVWAVVENHEHRDSLRGRLSEELKEGIDMCFTGRATRLLNSLQGIVEGVHIGVSEREAMLARIAVVLNKLEKTNGPHASHALLASHASHVFRASLRIELENVLTECMHDLVCGERDAWLQAFDEA